MVFDDDGQILCVRMNYANQLIMVDFAALNPPYGAPGSLWLVVNFVQLR